MPVYEFLCRDCNRVFNFLARDARAAKRTPACPKCGGKRMSKLFSPFAMASRGGAKPRSDARDVQPPGGEPDLSPEQEARLEREMARLARDMDSVDENDPRQLAAVMRRLSEATGQPMDPVTHEMLGRLEAGEDPDKVEEKMADALGDEGPGGGLGAPSRDEGLYDL